MIRTIGGSVLVSLFVSPSLTFASDVVDLAASLIGRPYVWGAEGPHAFDCSGLTQYVYQEFGVELPRRAVNQSKVGDRTLRLQRGDLLFFSSDSRQSLVTHVGIYEGRGLMIDASRRHGRVRRDDLNESFWAERFLFARRILGDDRGSDRVVRTSRREREGRKTAIRVLETLADVLIRRPRR